MLRLVNEHIFRQLQEQWTWICKNKIAGFVLKYPTGLRTHLKKNLTNAQTGTLLEFLAQTFFFGIIHYKILYIYNLRNSLKLKLLAFWRKQTPFIDQNCTYEKQTKNLGRALPPPHLDKIQINSYFFRETFSQRVSEILRSLPLLFGQHIAISLFAILTKKICACLKPWHL